MDSLNNALELLGFGIGVIPIRYKDKRPLADWKKYQKELPSEQQVRGWFKNQINFGVVTGWKGLVVLDFDDIDDCNHWKHWASKSEGKANWVMRHAYRVQTSRGMHVYTRIESPIKTTKVGKIDIKAGGGYVLGAGSVHPTGAIYTPARDNLIIPLIEALSDVLPVDVLIQNMTLPTGIRTPLRANQDDPWKAAADPFIGNDKSFVADIKKKYRIEDFFTKTTLTGRNYRMALCPFHQDDNDSMWIDTSKQICNCFACSFQKPLDVIDFYARLHSLSGKEAIHALHSSGNDWRS